MNTTTIESLAALIGADKVHTEDAVVNGRRHDYSVLSHLRVWRGDDVARPGVVVQPACTDDVAAVLRFAHAHAIPVMPFGLGSGVCEGIAPTRAVILVDMSEMNRIRDIDGTNLLASFDAGVNGLVAEQAVAKRGLTIGHWPQSIAISSVGGWVSTRAAGQFSTAYGNIEDIVYSIEAVLPNGDVVHLGKAPRAAAGPDLRHVLMGAEGTMGIVTGVTLSLRRAPETRALTAFYADDMVDGFEAQRQIIQADWRPPVMRQYDGPEVRRNFPDHQRGDSPLLLMVHEGPASRVAAEVEAVTAIATRAGLAPAPTEVVELWLERRNHVPEWRHLFELGLIADTIEVSARWTDIQTVYDDVVASLLEIDGVLNASAHSSHVYRSGLNLYFTVVAAQRDRERAEQTYRECWRRTMEATASGGGGIAHHHGVGRLRKPYLARELGDAGVGLLRAVKAAVDPNGIMNPGNLIPDAR